MTGHEVLNWIIWILKYRKLYPILSHKYYNLGGKIDKQQKQASASFHWCSVILFTFICAITSKVLGPRVLGSDVLEVKSEVQIC